LINLAAIELPSGDLRISTDAAGQTKLQARKYEAHEVSFL
jgi:hypothetical protein